MHVIVFVFFTQKSSAILLKKKKSKNIYYFLFSPENIIINWMYTSISKNFYSLTKKRNVDKSNWNRLDQ